ncbi:starch-binding domain-containing protein 1 [Arapaima gigas]
MTLPTAERLNHYSFRGYRSFQRERVESPLLCTALLGVGLVVVAWALLVACRRWSRRRVEVNKLTEKHEAHQHEIQNCQETTLLLGRNQDFSPSSDLCDMLEKTGSQAEKPLTSLEEHPTILGEDLTAELDQVRGLPGLVSHISEEPKLRDNSEIEHLSDQSEYHRPVGYQYSDGGQQGEPGTESSGSGPERAFGNVDGGSRQIPESSEKTDTEVPALDNHCEHEGQHSDFLHSLEETENETHDEDNSLRQVCHCDLVKGVVEVALEVSKGHCDIGVESSPSCPVLLDGHHGDHLADAAHSGKVALMESGGHGLSDGNPVGKKVMAVPPMPQAVDVYFRVHYMTASPWQHLAVTGSVPELGCWSDFVALDAAPAGFWARSVALPADSHVEWKFVLVENGKIQRWEECVNRHLDTTGGRDLQVHRWWGFL